MTQVNQHDAHPFLHLAQRYILRNKPRQAWQAAIVAARIAEARQDAWKAQACGLVVELCANCLTIGFREGQS